MLVAESEEELSSLMIEYKGESNIRTPLTVLSRERRNEDFEEIDRILGETKNAYSEIYSPAVIPSPKQKKIEEQEEEEEEDEIRSAMTRTGPDKYKGFKLNIQAVPVRSASEHSRNMTAYSQGFVGEFLALPWRDKLTFLFFGIVSLVMIYTSMQPMKRI